MVSVLCRTLGGGGSPLRVIAPLQRVQCRRAGLPMPIPSSADIQGTSDLLTVTYLPRGSSYVTLNTMCPEECSQEESCKDQDLWCQRFFKKVRQTNTGENPIRTGNIWDFERSTALTANVYFVRTPPMKGKGNCLLERNSITFAQVKGSFCFATRSSPQKRWKGFTNVPRMSWCGFANSASAVQSSLWDFGCPAFQIGKFHKSDLVLHYCHHHHGLSIKYNTHGPSV